MIPLKKKGLKSPFYQVIEMLRFLRVLFLFVVVFRLGDDVLRVLFYRLSESGSVILELKPFSDNRAQAFLKAGVLTIETMAAPATTPTPNATHLLLKAIIVLHKNQFLRRYFTSRKKNYNIRKIFRAEKKARES